MVFSRVFNATRAAGRQAVRTGRKTFSSGATPVAACRTGFAVNAMIVGLGVWGADHFYTEHKLAMCAAEAKPQERTNTAFVFIKPHAVTESAKTMVSEGLKAKGMRIVTEGALTAKQIDEGMLIDQHYYAIASKATILKPHQLNVPPEKFMGKFGIEWKDALAKGVVLNAADACTTLGLDAAGLNAEWAKAKKANKLVKFGGGFYCGLIDTVAGKPPLYVFNGFFMNMRNDYVKPGVSIYYYVVEWDSKKLAWADFRGKVLGPTDPADAPTDSMRGLFFNNWKSLGLAFQPNVGENGVHASASPFEALAERMNWLGAKINEDQFGKELVAAGMSESTIKEWSLDPVVTYGANSMPIKSSLFDSLEDCDSDMCLARAMMINMNNAPAYDPVQIGAGVAVGAVLGALATKA